MFRRPRAAFVVNFCILWVVAGGAAACAKRPQPVLAPVLPASALGATEMIGELKELAEALGGEATENFLRYSDRPNADNRCYFTGKVQLPEFYSALRMVREDAERCAERSHEYDVFFYPVQAVASGEETITVSLAEAPTERVLVVVPH